MSFGLCCSQYDENFFSRGSVDYLEVYFDHIPYQLIITNNLYMTGVHVTGKCSQGEMFE